MEAKKLPTGHAKLGALVGTEDGLDDGVEDDGDDEGAEDEGAEETEGCEEAAADENEGLEVTKGEDAAVNDNETQGVEETKGGEAAAYEGRLDMVRLLADELGACLDQEGESEWRTPRSALFMVAVDDEDKDDAMRVLLKAGAKVNQEDEDFLGEALERHAESMVQFQKLEARANDPTLESVRFLYEEFKPSCFMFMVYEVSRRIFLTGCLSMFVPDSISQIAIGLLGSLISYRVFNYYEPYVEGDDGTVSEVAQTELVLVFFYALMVFATNNLEQHDGVFSGKVFASLLVVLLASTLLVALWLIIVANFSGDDLRSCSRNSRRGLLDVRRSLSGLFTPRTPKEGGGGDVRVPVEAGAVEAEAIARI